MNKTVIMYHDNLLPQSYKNFILQRNLSQKIMITATLYLIFKQYAMPLDELFTFFLILSQFGKKE